MAEARKNLRALLAEALSHIKDPGEGLPDAAFEFALRLVPMINVDLLVRNEAGEHLLAWREDEYDAGWHVPGGIIRFNEPIEKRIARVATSELGCEVRYNGFPAEIKEFFTRRGHFISLMFLCRLADESAIPPRLASEPGRAKHGDVAWHRGVPPNLYRVHSVYGDWLNGRTTRGDHENLDRHSDPRRRR